MSSFSHLFPRLPTIACLQRKVFGLLRVGRGEYSPRRPDDCLRRGESVAGFSRSPPFFHTHVPRDSYGTLPTRNGCEPRSETGTRRASRGAARFSKTSREPHFVKTRSPAGTGRTLPAPRPPGRRATDCGPGGRDIRDRGKGDCLRG